MFLTQQYVRETIQLNLTHCRLNKSKIVFFLAKLLYNSILKKIIVIRLKNKVDVLFFKNFLKIGHIQIFFNLLRSYRGIVMTNTRRFVTTSNKKVKAKMIDCVLALWVHFHALKNT